jgi:hypothetical protein
MAIFFLPSGEIDALFRRKLSPDQFVKAMKDLYTLAAKTKFDPSNSLMDVIEELPAKKRVKLLRIAASL